MLGGRGQALGASFRVRVLDLGRRGPWEGARAWERDKGEGGQSFGAGFRDSSSGSHRRD